MRTTICICQAKQPACSAAERCPSHTLCSDRAAVPLDLRYFHGRRASSADCDAVSSSWCILGRCAAAKENVACQLWSGGGRRVLALSCPLRGAPRAAPSPVARMARPGERSRAPRSRAPPNKTKQSEAKNGQRFDLGTCFDSAYCMHAVVIAVRGTRGARNSGADIRPASAHKASA